MAKSRKKKNEKKDFQKVKFKVGKKLPKADNVTNVSFQSRGIHIKEQLRTDAEKPSTKRRQNITDLLSQLQHYNSSIRQDAVNGLKELITMHPQVGQQNLSTIIERVSSLFVDKDATIRQAVLKFYGVLFPLTSANQLAPFFSVINAHLCCAMTHIDEQIQSDSLLVVDVLLKHYPDVLIQHCSQVLPNFINLISKQRQMKSKAGTLGSQRMLSVNPSARIHAQKWRMKVLERLHNFLLALANNVKNSDKSATEDGATEILCSGRIYYQPMVPRPAGAVPFCSSFRLRPQNTTKTLPHQDILSQPEQLKRFVSMLIPLLLDCWVECLPANVAENAQPGDVMAMRLSIVKVIQLLWQCVQGLSADNEEVSVSWLADSYMTNFIHHFMAHFPYSGQERVERNKKSKKVEIKQISMVGLNLRICDIMVYFVVEKHAKVSHSYWLQNLMEFVIEAADGGRIPAEESAVLMDIFKRLLKVEFEEGSELLNDLLSAVWSMYKKSHPASVERRNLLTLIIHDILPRKHYISYPVMQEWLASLPDNLLTCNVDSQATVSLLLEAMGKVAGQKHHIFTVNLQNNLERILDPENGILLRLQPTHQRKLVEVLYSVKQLDKNALKILLTCCRDERFDVKNVGYLLQILHHRYQTDGLSFCDSSSYLSFMLSLGCGPVMVENTETDGLPNGSQQEETHPGMMGFQRHSKIVQDICDLLTLWPNVQQVWMVVVSFLLKYKKTTPNLSLSAGVSFLQLTRTLYHHSASSEQKDVVIIAETVVSVAMGIVSMKLEDGPRRMETDNDVTDVAYSVCPEMSGRVLLVVEDVLTMVPGMVTLCAQRIYDLLKECVTPDARMLLLMTLTRMLKPLAVKAADMDKVQFKQIMQDILHSHANPEYSQQVAALKYEMSLFKR